VHYFCEKKAQQFSQNFINIFQNVQAAFDQTIRLTTNIDNLALHSEQYVIYMIKAACTGLVA
jgi:hypothetical protein